MKKHFLSTTNHPSRIGALVGASSLRVHFHDIPLTHITLYIPNFKVWVFHSGLRNRWQIQHSYLNFCKPTHETERGTANRWGTTNSKPPGPNIMIDQSKTGSSSRIIFITLFSSRCTALLCFLPASANWANTQEKTHFPELNKPAYVDFSSSKFIVHGHILSTVGECSKNYKLVM